MTLFTNRYRRRIEIRITELKVLQEAAKKKRDSYKISLAPADRIHWTCEVGNLQSKIDLLQSLLDDSSTKSKKQRKHERTNIVEDLPDGTCRRAGHNGNREVI